jgi:hypothetical protein
MKETAYNRIAETIRARHTWITVLQSDRERSLMVQVGRELREVRCRVLSLVALRGHGLYGKGHVWDIPEYNLDKAVRSLKRNPGFKERWNREAATPGDIEEIINRASYGFIRLELSDL